MNFSYHLTMGNMDEAYKAVKTIKDENVWPGRDAPLPLRSAQVPTFEGASFGPIRGAHLLGYYLAVGGRKSGVCAF